jgi:Holliday junction resolvasome RuvABC endonuclease subunit
VNILALDLAIKTGWAARQDDGDSKPLYSSGVQEFALRRGESPGMRFLRFRSWLTSMSDYINIDVIVYEQAHHRGGAATQLAVGLVTDTLAHAARIWADTMPVHTGTLKKFVTGSGRASKEKMVTAAKVLGWKPQDDNEADAIHLLRYAENELGLTSRGDSSK